MPGYKVKYKGQIYDIDWEKGTKPTRDELRLAVSNKILERDAEGVTKPTYSTRLKPPPTPGLDPNQYARTTDQFGNVIDYEKNTIHGPGYTPPDARGKLANIIEEMTMTSQGERKDNQMWGYDPNYITNRASKLPGPLQYPVAAASEFGMSTLKDLTADPTSVLMPGILKSGFAARAANNIPFLRRGEEIIEHTDPGGFMGPINQPDPIDKLPASIRSPKTKVSAAEAAANIQKYGSVLPTLEKPPAPIKRKLTAAEFAEAQRSGKLPDLTPPGAPSAIEQQLKASLTERAEEALPRLPSELAGAKPRYNIGKKQYTPAFDNEVDKAAYIISQTTKSKRDADYLKFVMEATGLDEASARALGIKVRSALKTAAKDAKPGSTVRIGRQVGEKLKKTESVIDAAKKVIGATADDMPLPSGTRSAPLNSIPPSSPQPPSGFGGDIEKVPYMQQMAFPEIGPRPPINPPSMFQNIINLPKSLKTTGDLSAPGRQMLGLIHKKEYWQALKPMWDVFKDTLKKGNEGQMYDAIRREIMEHPKLNLAQDSGLHLGDILGNVEEQISSNLSEKIPMFGRLAQASNKAYTTAINHTRMNTFSNLIDEAGRAGTVSADVSRNLAEFVNTATGRGNMGPKLEKAAEALNTAFFSPKLVASRMQVFNPQYYTKMDPFTRKQQMQSALAMISLGSSLAGVASMIPGVEVNMEPTNSDFGKIKIGNTRIDPYGGLQQFVVTAARHAQQKTTSTQGKEYKFGETYTSPTSLSELGRFALSKASPLAGFAARVAAQKDAAGKPINYPKELMDLVLPMYESDLFEIGQENPSMLPLIGILSGLGVGVQTFEPNPPKSSGGRSRSRSRGRR